MAMREDRVKHLEMIQGVINRMANNSFFLKGWSMTLTAALLALAGGSVEIVFAAVALAPALAFWSLDAYYLKLERQYRKLYDHVRQEILADAPIDDLYSLDARPYAKQVDGYWRTAISSSVGALHGAVVLVILTVLFVLWSVG